MGEAGNMRRKPDTFADHEWDMNEKLILGDNLPVANFQRERTPGRAASLCMTVGLFLERWQF